MNVVYTCYIENSLSINVKKQLSLSISSLISNYTDAFGIIVMTNNVILVNDFVKSQGFEGFVQVIQIKNTNLFLNGHLLDDYRLAFAKIAAMKTYIGFSEDKVLFVDLDTIFLKRKKIITTLKDLEFMCINYGVEQHRNNLNFLARKLNLNSLFYRWFNSGFIFCDISILKCIVSFVELHIEDYKLTGLSTKDFYGHYSDELILSLAFENVLASLNCKALIVNLSFGWTDEITLIWTGFTEAARNRYLSIFKPPFNVHLPDIKYTDKHLLFYDTIMRRTPAFLYTSVFIFLIFITRIYKKIYLPLRINSIR
jgi:hypothetical protein